MLNRLKHLDNFEEQEIAIKLIFILKKYLVFSKLNSAILNLIVFESCYY